MGPALYEFGWKWDEWNQLAGASVAGHLIECGAQVTGGYSTDWQDKRLGDVGPGWKWRERHLPETIVLAFATSCWMVIWGMSKADAEVPHVTIITAIRMVIRIPFRMTCSFIANDQK